MPDQDQRLRAAVDAVVPADDVPSASAVGVDAFLRSEAVRSYGWAERVDAVLDRLDEAAAEREVTDGFAALSADVQQEVLAALADEPEIRWFLATVGAAYHADSASGGNTDPAIWAALGWTPDPPGGWPDVDVPPLDRSAVVGAGEVRRRYDAVVVGSGAGAGSPRRS